MKEDTLGKLEELATGVCEAHGCELFLLDFVSAGKRSILRVFIDREGGVSIDDCSRVSQELSVLLDVEDIIAHEFSLEVSSPGLNRPIRGPQDFISLTGRKVKIVAHKTVGDHGEKTFVGKLKEYKEQTATVQTQKGEVLIAQDNIKRANLEFEFDE